MLTVGAQRVSFGSIERAFFERLSARKRSYKHTGYYCTPVLQLPNEKYLVSDQPPRRCRT